MSTKADEINVAVDQQETDPTVLSIFTSKHEEEAFKQEAESAVYDLGKHVKVDFKELFNEPDAYQDTKLGKTIGEKVIGVGFFNMYNYVQAGTYYVLSIVVGFVATLFWAITFGVNSIVIIWIAQPCTKLFFTWLRLAGIIVRALVRSFCDPCSQSASLVFTSIRGRFNIKQQSG